MKTPKNAFRKIVFSVMLLLMLAAAGCSLIGLGIGTAIDHRKPNHRLITGWSYRQVHTGDLISVQCRDGNVFRGRFLGVMSLEDAGYAALLESAASKNAIAVPHSGGRVTVRFQSGMVVKAEFHGFDYQSPGRGLYPIVRLRLLDSNAVSEVQLSAIGEISDSAGAVLSGDEIRNGLARGTLPSRTALLLDTAAVRVVSIPAFEASPDRLALYGTSPGKLKIVSARTKTDSLIVFNGDGAHLTVSTAAIRGRTEDYRLYLGLLADIKTLDLEIYGNATAPITMALSGIENIEVPQSKHGAATGFLIGLTIDVTVVVLTIAAASALNNSGSEFTSSDGGSFSCPFVYSYDGARYIPEAEVFGGAIFEKAQRTDFACLDSLVPVNDRYRVKLTNELEEIQYVDQCKLLAIDHAVGVEVCPSEAGRMLTFRDRLKPVKATSERGSDVLRLVQSNDELVWCGNPFTCDTSQHSQLRDGVVVDFLRPNNADSMTLVLNLQNTQWSARTLYDLLSLYGSHLQEAYDTLNNSEFARRMLQRAALREGALSVAVWDGSQWQEAASIWEVGPTVARNRALRIPTACATGAHVRIKFESSVGFWIINAINADFSEPGAFAITELTLESALDQNSRSVRPALGAVDGEYYVMPSTGDWAQLMFTAPPQPAQTTRTLVLQASGYYTVKMAELGPGNPERIAAILTCPTELANFAVGRLQETIQNSEATNDSL